MSNIDQLKDDFLRQAQDLEGILNIFPKRGFGNSSYFLNDIIINRDLFNKIDSFTTKDYFLLRSHGFSQIMNAGKKVFFAKVPDNVCICFLSTLGCQISNEFNNFSASFFNNIKKVESFINHPHLEVNHGLNHLYICPPGSWFLETYIEKGENGNEDYNFNNLSTKKPMNLPAPYYKKIYKLSDILKQISKDKKKSMNYIFIDSCRELFIPKPMMTPQLVNTEALSPLSKEYSYRLSRQTGCTFSSTKQVFVCNYPNHHFSMPLLSHIGDHYRYFYEERRLIHTYFKYEKMRSDLYKKEKFKINVQNQPHLNHPNMRNMHLNKNHIAARKIQTIFRQKLAKQKVAKIRINKAKTTAATKKENKKTTPARTIQNKYTQKLAEDKQKVSNAKQNKAARKIQKTVRALLLSKKLAQFSLK